MTNKTKKKDKNKIEKPFLVFVNTIMANFGMRIYLGRLSKKDKNNKKYKINHYEILFLDKINKYI